MSGIWVTTGYIGICRWLGFTYQAYPSTVKKILENCIIIMLVIDDIYELFITYFYAVFKIFSILRRFNYKSFI